MSQLNASIHADQILDMVYVSVRVADYSIEPGEPGYEWFFTDSFPVLDFGSRREWLNALVVGLAEGL